MPRRVLITLQVFVAVMAAGGATYGLAGAEGVAVEWLEGTPFSDYTIPSVILGSAVGGSAAAAVAGLLLRRRWGPIVAFLAADTLLVWIIVQVALIGYVSWLQPFMFAVGVVEGVLAARELRTALRAGA